MTNAIATAHAIADLLSPPGETLQEALEERGMTQKEFAKRTGSSLKTINKIIHGKSPLTVETAIRFESVLGIPASFWLKREQHYREALTRRKVAPHL
jgi:HTH-type transcriptional regulator / antitoxin HigA